MADDDDLKEAPDDGDGTFNNANFEVIVDNVIAANDIEAGDSQGVFTVTNSTYASPRNTANVTAGNRVENYFVGDPAVGGAFSRTGIGGTAGKLSYAVPNETGTRAQFAAGLWTLWAPKAAHAGKGCPDWTTWF
jgi:hypothetical protein